MLICSTRHCLNFARCKLFLSAYKNKKLAEVGKARGNAMVITVKNNISWDIFIKYAKVRDSIPTAAAKKTNSPMPITAM